MAEERNCLKGMDIVFVDKKGWIAGWVKTSSVSWEQSKNVILRFRGKIWHVYYRSKKNQKMFAREDE